MIKFTISAFQQKTHCNTMNISFLFNIGKQQEYNSLCYTVSSVFLAEKHP